MFDLLGERPVLDFVATVSERGTTHVERLRTAQDLQQWVRESGIVDEDVLVSSADLTRAIELREACFALITALIDRRPVPSPDRDLLNEWAERRRPTVRLGQDLTVRRLGDLAAVLAELAADALRLCDDADREALRWCDGEQCTRPFLDRSRGRRRRWCDMRSCGDRVKAASYRQRHQG